MELWKRVTIDRLRQTSYISKNRFSFVARRLALKAIYLLASYWMKQKYPHMFFINQERPRIVYQEKLCRSLQKLVHVRLELWVLWNHMVLKWIELKQSIWNISSKRGVSFDMEVKIGDHTTTSHCFGTWDYALDVICNWKVPIS